MDQRGGYVRWISLGLGLRLLENRMGNVMYCYMHPHPNIDNLVNVGRFIQSTQYSFPATLGCDVTHSPL